MLFSFEKLGPIDKDTIELGDLTVLCGSNSSGKTYLSYSIYGILDEMNDFLSTFLISDDMMVYARELIEDGSLSINLRSHEKDIPKLVERHSKRFSRDLDRFFSTRDMFKKTEIKMEKKDIQQKYVDIPPMVMKTLNYTLQLSPNEDKLLITIISDEKSIEREAREMDLIARRIYSIIFTILFKDLFPIPFIVTSERTGVALFYKELDLTKNNMISMLSDSSLSKKPNIAEIMNKFRARYAQPIQDNIDLVRDSIEKMKDKSFFVKDGHKDIFKLLQKIVGGTYKVIGDQLYFVEKKERGRDQVIVPLYIASSSVKSLYLLDLYINCIAQPNDILIIDEPELNIHPDKQRLMARLLARLANSGIKVLITTHSDYLLNELSCLIALSGNVDNKDDIVKKYNVEECDIIKPEKVKAYLCKNHKIINMDVNNIGIDTSHFVDIAMNASDFAMDINSNSND